MPASAAVPPAPTSTWRTPIGNPSSSDRTRFVYYGFFGVGVWLLHLLLRLLGRLVVLHFGCLDPRGRTDRDLAGARALYRRGSGADPETDRRTAVFRRLYLRLLRAVRACRAGLCVAAGAAWRDPQPGAAAPPHADRLRLPDVQSVLCLRRAAQHPADAGLGEQVDRHDDRGNVGRAGWSARSPATPTCIAASAWAARCASN